jgi:calcium-dependent protein kinase
VSMEENVLKIVDFGLATQWDIPEYLFKRCGTPGFVAPEVMNAASTGKVNYTPKCDVFSAGVIFYLL